MKDALDRGEISVNHAWKIMNCVQQFPPKEQDALTAEMLSAMREVKQVDVEADRRGKIAGYFYKAYEKALLLTPTLENIRDWVECTRMKADEIEDSIHESYELAQTFQTIGDILKTEILPHR